MRIFTKFCATALIALMPFMAQAADTSALTDAQKAAVEDVVRELLTKKEPEIVMKAAMTVQGKMEEESAGKSKKALSENKDKVFNDPAAPFAGNAKGDVTVVQFFDYQCGYCKAVVPTIAKLLTEDKNVKVIYREYPILGEGSVLASKAAIASMKQGKYLRFHDALMTSKGQLNEEAIMKLAKTVDIDTDKLKKDMADESIERTIRANQILGQKIGANGTPTFIIGDNIYPGALQYEQLKSLIEEQRKGAKK